MERHIHKYERMDIGINKPHIVYRCALPYCMSHIPAKMARGKETLCWGCERVLILTMKEIRSATNPKKMVKHPMCEECKAERLAKRKALQAI